MIARGTEKDSAMIERNLLSSLREELPQSVNESFTLVANGKAGLIGGITAVAAYGWLLVKTLWGDPSHRRKGLGRSLLSQAEQERHDLGCHSVWLETSNPAARSFYTEQGYSEFAQLTNGQAKHPATHRRWFLSRSLSPKAIS